MEAPLSSKKEAALPTAESALTLFIIMVNQCIKMSILDLISVRYVHLLDSPLAFVSVGVLLYIFPKEHSFISFFPVDHDDRNDAQNPDPERGRASGGHLVKSGRSGVFIQATVQKKNETNGAFKHPKYAGLVNDIALLNDDSFRKTKLFKFFFSKKSPSDSPTSHPLKRTLPAVMELIEKFIDLGGIGELIKGIEMMIEIILRNRRIPYGYNFYLNEVKKMRSLLSNRTKTNTLIESVKIKSVYQSASPIAQDISFQPRNKTRSFRSIFSQIVKDIRLVMKKGVEGIRICCSGRSEGAEIARTECGKCSRGCKPDGTRLGFGRYGTKSLRAGRLSYRAIEAARRAIIGQFHQVRMGRGKGNPTDWIARVSTGQIPFEMDGGISAGLPSYRGYLVIDPFACEAYHRFVLFPYALMITDSNCCNKPPLRYENEVNKLPEFQQLRNDAIKGSSKVRIRGLSGFCPKSSKKPIPKVLSNEAQFKAVIPHHPEPQVSPSIFPRSEARASAIRLNPRKVRKVTDSAASLSKSLCRDHESAAIEGVVPEPAGRIPFVGIDRVRPENVVTKKEGKGKSVKSSSKNERKKKQSSSISSLEGKKVKLALPALCSRYATKKPLVQAARTGKREERQQDINSPKEVKLRRQEFFYTPHWDRRNLPDISERRS
ncbi:hypothetical protein L2E82_53286 [Cichorium intybus]|nr:hypothetical protein L2E82_53286 [Cichorium intybus]